jgi:hypothetical protein
LLRGAPLSAILEALFYGAWVQMTALTLSWAVCWAFRVGPPESGQVQRAGVLAAVVLILVRFGPVRKLLKRIPYLMNVLGILLGLGLIQRFSPIPVPSFTQLSLVGFLRAIIVDTVALLPVPVVQAQAQLLSDRLARYDVSSFAALPPGASVCFWLDWTSLGYMILFVVFFAAVLSILFLLTSELYGLVAFGVQASLLGGGIVSTAIVSDTQGIRTEAAAEATRPRSASSSGLGKIDDSGIAAMVRNTRVVRLMGGAYNGASRVIMWAAPPMQRALHGLAGNIKKQ